MIHLKFVNDALIITMQLDSLEQYSTYRDPKRDMNKIVLNFETHVEISHQNSDQNQTSATRETFDSDTQSIKLLQKI
jgi:hypothetical protein